MSTNAWEDEELLLSVKKIINRFDSDYTREGLKDTPRRFLKFLQEFSNPEEFNFTTFNKEKYDQMVVVSPIPFFSICEHHLAPFFGEGSIGYIPNEEGRICGLSKLPRVLKMFSQKFQNQERITDQVADFLMEHLKPKGVGVRLKARHLCMEMRGVKTHDTFTITTSLRGCIKEEDSARAEFFKATEV